MKKMLVQEKKFKGARNQNKASEIIRRVITLDINLGGYDELKKRIIERAISKESAYVCFANVHMTIESKHNEYLRKGINEAFCVLPDGMPLVWALKIFYGIKQKRITGMDMMPDMLRAAEKYNLPVFFVGSTEEVLEKVRNKCRIEYPDAKIAGHLSPPFKELNEEEEGEIINKIQRSGARIVFVALGCPKQELFMYRLSHKIQAVMFGIGGALPVFAGEIGRAPAWMQDNGLEWFYRFIQEPKRLFKRYAYTNSLFIIYIVKQLIKRDY